MNERSSIIENSTNPYSSCFSIKNSSNNTNTCHFTNNTTNNPAQDKNKKVTRMPAGLDSGTNTQIPKETPLPWYNPNRIILVSASQQEPSITTEYGNYDFVDDTTIIVEIPQDKYTVQKLSCSRGNKKLGHLCCGGCCDTRRAVMIVDTINAIVSVLALISVLVIKKANKIAGTYIHNSATSYSNYMDDDSFVQSIDETYQLFMHSFLPLNVILVIVMIRLIGSVIGLVGAYRYNTTFVGVTAVLYCLDIGFGIILTNVIDIILYGFMVYPHFVFIYEVNCGIMTPERYTSNEEFCCCCV